MQSLERNARTVDEAIELALAELGVERDQVSIEVLSEGRSGIWGIGAEEARVRVTLRDAGAPATTTIRPARSARPVAAPAQDGSTAAAAAAVQDSIGASGREVLEKILSFLGLETTVDLKAPSTYGMAEGQVSCVLDIEGPDLGLLIGRRGKTLFALQYLVNLILSKRYRTRVKIFVDVEGYRLRREDSLRSLAVRMADQVRSTGQSVTLEAMPPHERRIVHLALQASPHVLTESVGEGEDRKVIINPKR